MMSNHVVLCLGKLPNRPYEKVRYSPIQVLYKSFFFYIQTQDYINLSSQITPLYILYARIYFILEYTLFLCRIRTTMTQMGGKFYPSVRGRRVHPRRTNEPRSDR